MVRFISLVALCFLFSGCASLLPTKKMQLDGIYVVDNISTKGATKNVYHFVDDKHVRQLFKVKRTNDELIGV